MYGFRILENSQIRLFLHPHVCNSVCEADRRIYPVVLPSYNDRASRFARTKNFPETSLKKPLPFRWIKVARKSEIRPALIPEIHHSLSLAKDQFMAALIIKSYFQLLFPYFDCVSPR